MRRLAWLAALLLMMSACAADIDDRLASKPTVLSSTDPVPDVDDYSLVGLDVPDEIIEGAGMTPVRTWAAACALLFGERDVPRLSASPQALSGSDVSEFQNILMSVGYSGPDELRDDAGQLVDHLDTRKDFPSRDPESLEAEKLIADRMAENCERRG